ncbi:MAG: hypothetical protein O9276_20505 [Microcystis sp. LE17-20A]|jgi:hypothetical protein|uniref:hypothetical protein n=1 Tax=Microcystis TaxID=1125 RepID=UPI0016801901|nr:MULTISPECIES: hypothetical protein [Microcystis]MBD2118087.1 hypothetical protein [Microcystis wesenbergii FACHB-1339]MCZ8040421.1 hypothetical protein [Microcystis sp. LE17-20A]MCZ8212988.1 hypothetical protein [Microcystis sp. LE19-8.1F]
MAALLDDLGIWNDLGTIMPDGNWQFFPNQATQGLSVFRITWGGDLSDIKSRVQLRAIYNRSGFSVPSTRWFRLYPKQGSEIIFLDFPDELKARQVVRGFQAMKWYKYLKNGLNSDSKYSLNLQEFQPLPEYIDNINQRLEQIYAILSQLPQADTSNTNLLL